MSLFRREEGRRVTPLFAWIQAGTTTKEMSGAFFLWMLAAIVIRAAAPSRSRRRWSSIRSMTSPSPGGRGCSVARRCVESGAGSTLRKDNESSASSSWSARKSTSACSTCWMSCARFLWRCLCLLRVWVLRCRCRFDSDGGIPSSSYRPSQTAPMSASSGCLFNVLPFIEFARPRGARARGSLISARVERSGELVVGRAELCSSPAQATGRLWSDVVCMMCLLKRSAWRLIGASREQDQHHGR